MGLIDGSFLRHTIFGRNIFSSFSLRKNGTGQFEKDAETDQNFVIPPPKTTGFRRVKPNNIEETDGRNGNGKKRKRKKRTNYNGAA